MGHFAKVNNGKVEQVIVAEPEFFDTFIDTTPGQWIQTSYNTFGGVHYGSDGQPDGGVALRGNFAGIGFTYDAENDVFYAPRPVDFEGAVCQSWTISAPTWIWTPPTPAPNNGKAHQWQESTQTWLEIA